MKESELSKLKLHYEYHQPLPILRKKIRKAVKRLRRG